VLVILGATAGLNSQAGALSGIACLPADGLLFGHTDSQEGMCMRIRSLIFCGILAPIVYVAIVITGGLLLPGYNHIANFISDLISRGAPNRWFLDPVFGLYNVFCMAFGLGVFWRVRTVLENKRRMIGLVGATILVLTGVFGFLTLFAPEDPVGTLMSSTGVTHIILAGLSSLTTMVSMLLLGLWLRGSQETRRMGIYSFISVGFVFVTGGITAGMGASHGPVVGLMERLTIGGFMQWLFVLAMRLSGGIRRVQPAR
jgi:hypothetical membrane protein